MQNSPICVKWQSTRVETHLSLTHVALILVAHLFLHASLYRSLHPQTLIHSHLLGQELHNNLITMQAYQFTHLPFVSMAFPFEHSTLGMLHMPCKLFCLSEMHSTHTISQIWHLREVW